MIKEVQQISIFLFVLRVCYDTINFISYKLKGKTENELLVVKHEIEDTKYILNETIPYENDDIPIWPVTLGFLFVVTLFWILAKHIFLRKIRPKSDKQDKEKHVQSSNKYRHHGDKPLNKNHPDADDVSEEIFIKNADVNHDLSSKGEVALPCKVYHNDPTVYRATVQNESFQSISASQILDGEIIPPSPVFEILNNETLLSTTLQMDCTNSKFLCDMIIENRNIGKVNSPLPKSLFTEENRPCVLQFALDEEANLNNDSSTTNEMSIYHQENHALKFPYTFQNNVEPLPKDISCEKSTSPVHLVYTESDLKSLEKRLETVEHELKSSEEKMMNWDYRILSAEKDLLDLQGQVHTLYSKIEEGQNTNVIIVSQVPDVTQETMSIDTKKAITNAESDESDGTSQNSKTDTDTNLAKLANIITQKEKKGENESFSAMDRKYQSSKKKLEKIKEQNLHEITPSPTGDGDSINGDEDDTLSAYKSSAILISKMKKKTVALETMLENNSDVIINKYNRRRSPPSPRVPTHIVPPYKRSAFSSTNSRLDLIKMKKKFKCPLIQRKRF